MPRRPGLTRLDARPLQVVQGKAGEDAIMALEEEVVGLGQHLAVVLGMPRLGFAALGHVQPLGGEVAHQVVQPVAAASLLEAEQRARD